MVLQKDDRRVSNDNALVGTYTIGTESQSVPRKDP